MQLLSLLTWERRIGVFMWLCGSQWNRKNYEGEFLFSRDFYETYKELITYFHENTNPELATCYCFWGEKNLLFQQK